jgi:NTP pyrophosphatase (non-canonical NTP hydrolase)
MGDDIVKLQHELELRYGTDPERLIGKSAAEFARWNVLAATDELHEALHLLPWKPWKNYSIDELETVDWDEFGRELADVLHFLLNLFLLAGCRTFDDVVELYKGENAKNAKRLEAGVDR